MEMEGWQKGKRGKEQKGKKGKQVEKGWRVRGRGVHTFTMHGTGRKEWIGEKGKEYSKNQ